MSPPVILRVYAAGDQFDFEGDGRLRRASAYARNLTRVGIAFTAAYVCGASSARLREGWWRS